MNVVALSVSNETLIAIAAIVLIVAGLLYVFRR